MGVAAVKDASEAEVGARVGFETRSMELADCVLLYSDVADAVDGDSGGTGLDWPFDTMGGEEGEEVTNSTEVSSTVDIIGGDFLSCRSAGVRADWELSGKHSSGIAQLGLAYGDARTTLTAARAIEIARYVCNENK